MTSSRRVAPFSVKVSATVTPMSQRKAGPGRPGLGKRHAVLTRLPVDVAQLVIAEAEARDMPYGAYVAAIVANAHGIPAELPPRLTEVPQQGELLETRGLTA